MFTIAIIGRPNVGKSTLFNKLAGQALAIVNDYAGVTRDRKEAIGYLGPLTFNMIDTAGWDREIKKEELEFKMIEQTEIAIREADLCLFLLDAKTGVMPNDKFFADKLRKSGIPCVVVLNKSEGVKHDWGFDQEYYKLGFGEPVGISAEHKDGWNYLYDAIEPFYDKYQEITKDLEVVESQRVHSNNKNNIIEDEIEEEIDIDQIVEGDIDEDDFDEDNFDGEDSDEKKSKNNKINSAKKDKNDNDWRPIQLAIVGRPNAGKSTLINQLLNEDRVIVSDVAGTTRDSISIDWEYKGRQFKLIDTAGIRKRKNICEDLEKLSVDDAFRAVRFSQIVVLMMDAENLFDSQDLSLASILVKEGRGVVFVLNKWDKIPMENKQSVMNNAIEIVETNVPEIKGAPIIPLSAINGYNIDKLMVAVFEVYASWNAYISTSKLNRWLEYIQEEHTPPLFKGRSVKLKYMTQAKKRPPTFVLFTNSPERLEQTNYNRYLINRLRIDFDLKGTVIRIILRKSDNPYKDKKERKHLKGKLNTKKHIKH